MLPCSVAVLLFASAAAAQARELVLPYAHMFSSDTVHDAPLQTSRIKLATLNVRYAPPGQSTSPPWRNDDEWPWVYRREAIIDQVAWESPDIVGFQECLFGQLQDLQNALAPVYDSVGVGRDDGERAGEAVPIFYNKARFARVSVEYFWLSKTPTVPGSKDWDAGQTRMVTLIYLRDLSANGSDIYVLNTHYDDRGEVSRAEASKIVLSRLRLLTQSSNDTSSPPLILLLGDLNSPPDEDGYRILTGYRYTTGGSPINGTMLDARHLQPYRSVNGTVSLEASLLSARPYGSNMTFTGFSSGANPQPIDFILFADNGAVRGAGTTRANSNQYTVTRFGVIPNKFENGDYPFRLSDHNMVVAVLER